MHKQTTHNCRRHLLPKHLLHLARYLIEIYSWICQNLTNDEQLISDIQLSYRLFPRLWCCTDLSSTNESAVVRVSCTCGNIKIFGDGLEWQFHPNSLPPRSPPNITGIWSLSTRFSRSHDCSIVSFEFVRASRHAPKHLLYFINHHS